LKPASPLTIELIADEEFGGFTARLPDVPAYGEGNTEQEAIEDLRKALVGYIETFGVDDALNRISKPQLRQVNWSLAEMVSE
jgi:predicted RNase H-like HicB family nuclease